jgi:hypothetical protein
MFDFLVIFYEYLYKCCAIHNKCVFEINLIIIKLKKVFFKLKYKFALLQV